MRKRRGYFKGMGMRLFVFTSLIGLFLAGCVSEEPVKIQACSESGDQRCSAVVYFSTNSAEISPYGMQRLDWSVEKMKQQPNNRALITAHADEWSNEEYNMELSRQRAKTVGLYMVQQGIDPKRIRVRPRGSEEPVCLKFECQDLNRRAIVEMYHY